jgi:hypothetical protein
MSERHEAAGAESDTRIVRAAIYPAIGVGHLGNSEDRYFLAPEVVDPLPEEPGFYRDQTDALKRQAVRFESRGLCRTSMPASHRLCHCEQCDATQPCMSSP